MKIKHILGLVALTTVFATPSFAKQYLNTDGTQTDGVRVEYGAGGSPVDTTNPLPVGGRTVSVCVTPTITASTYAIKQAIGGLITFPNAFRTATGSGILQDVVVTSKSVQTVGLTFYPFDTNPTASTLTDHATAAIAAADVGRVRTPTALNTAYSDLGTHTVWGAYGLGQAFAPGATTLYGVLVAQGTTAAFASTSDIQICAKVLQD